MKVFYGLKLWIILSLFILPNNSLADQEAIIVKDEAIAEISLPIPEDTYLQNYLGLKGKGNFKISDIEAQGVLIIIFSMYCPYCQKEAPHINELFLSIENDPFLKGKIKLLGIGARDSSYEVKLFKEKYNVPYPLFADKGGRTNRTLGGLPTPYFILVSLKEKENPKIVYTHQRGFEDKDEFLKTIMDKLSLKREGQK